jgi:hypothetical protein
MKSLYESILDDEDVLIGDVKSSINDIFTYILFSKNSGISWGKFMDKLNEYVDEIISYFPSLKKSKYKFEFNSERKTYNEGKRIVWLEVDIPLYSDDKKTIFFIILDEDNSIRLAFSRHWDFGIKLRNRVNEKDYQNDMNNFAKKFGFNRNVSFYSFIKQM